MRTAIQVTSGQTAAAARRLVDAEWKHIRSIALSREKIVGQIAGRLLSGREAGAVLEVLDRNEMRDENVSTAERIAAGWKELA